MTTSYTDELVHGAAIAAPVTPSLHDTALAKFQPSLSQWKQSCSIAHKGSFQHFSVNKL